VEVDDAEFGTPGRTSCRRSVNPGAVASLRNIESNRQ
jgi:hypothetical protein